MEDNVFLTHGGRKVTEFRVQAEDSGQTHRATQEQKWPLKTNFFACTVSFQINTKDALENRYSPPKIEYLYYLLIMDSVLSSPTLMMLLNATSRKICMNAEMPLTVPKYDISFSFLNSSHRSQLEQSCQDHNCHTWLEAHIPVRSQINYKFHTQTKDIYFIYIMMIIWCQC